MTRSVAHLGSFRSFTSGLLVFVAFSLGASNAAHANPIYSAPTPPVQLPPPPPSPFETGMRGFGTGLVAGLAGGYLFAREDGFHARDWRPLVAGAGVGALCGGVLGFTLGMVDNNAPVPGRGYLVMRGMAYGGTFGMVTGGIIGGLAALSTDKPEHILFGAAIGTLSGTVLGLVLGSVEKNPWAGGGQGPRSWSFGITPYATTRGTLAMGPSLSGRF
ncbi:MAG: hypothetical protein ABI560_14185 [Myxococcales bacterium]